MVYVVKVGNILISADHKNFLHFAVACALQGISVCTDRREEAAETLFLKIIIISVLHKTTSSQLEEMRRQMSFYLAYLHWWYRNLIICRQCAPPDHTAGPK